MSEWNTDTMGCPLDVPVLVTNGVDVGVDRLVRHYEINGRVLLPSDKRRMDMDPEIRWEKYEDVTHWMPLPEPPKEKP